ncbi:hypothetical protein K1719_040227 [Acacia pycnantha]|nr:hypothetical protein K1719_043128 [Acacia pycnantha]KAI9077741.1 hypothetical protein K1719_040227 [Acacia pycnantha]
MKKHKALEANNPFDSLMEELVFTILDHLPPNSLDKKSFSLVCKSFYAIEAKHRRTIRPFRSELLPSILNRYPFVSHADLSLCPRVSDSSLDFLANACSATLRRIDLSRSRFFSANGLFSLATNCKNLVELDLSNATELKDAAASAVAQAKNLEKLWLARWVDLIAVKCKELRSLDLSYLPITGKCLSSIVKLHYLEDLVLEGCFGIDDDSLDVFKQGCTTLKRLDISGCQNISHIGLSALTSCSGSIEYLTLSDGSPVTPALAEALNKLPMLQSIILDGCMVTSDGLRAIGSSCMSLKELSLRKCLGVTDEALSFIVSKHKDLRKLDITCCRKITHLSIVSIVTSCKRLSSLRMESCTLVPREAFVMIGQQCDSLEELDLTDNEIDDEGLRSISRCSRLASLKLGICLNITDKGLAYVGKSCSKLKELDLYRSTGITDLELKTLEIRGCLLVTSKGLAAIAPNCKQLSRLDIKKCYKIDDSGMIPLACCSQNLKQINLSYSSVTEVGLLSLASINCLHTFCLLTLQGVSPRGLAAALLAFGGLRKVKLHVSLRSKLPEPLIKHIEARGCVFEWSNKVFQAEMDPKCWKLQLEDLMEVV